MLDKMSLDFSPYIGVDSLLFGMSRTQVEALLGKPEKQDKYTFPPYFETSSYPHLNLEYNLERQLSAMVFHRFRGSLRLQGIDILRDKDALAKLIALDQSPYLWVGFIMLMQLGIRLGGYHESEEGGRTVKFFAKGRHDNNIHRFEPFNLNEWTKKHRLPTK